MIKAHQEDDFMARELAIAAMHRMLKNKKVGAERVSESAAEELAKVLEDIGSKIGRQATKYAMHAGRKTVKRKDIVEAYKLLQERL